MKIEMDNKEPFVMFITITLALFALAAGIGMYVSREVLPQFTKPVEVIVTIPKEAVVIEHAAGPVTVNVPEIEIPGMPPIEIPPIEVPPVHVIEKTVVQDVYIAEKQMLPKKLDMSSQETKPEEPKGGEVPKMSRLGTPLPPPRHIQKGEGDEEE